MFVELSCLSIHLLMDIWVVSTFVALFLHDCALGIWFELRYLTPRKISKQQRIQGENEGEGRCMSKSCFVLLEGAAFKAEHRKPFYLFII